MDDEKTGSATQVGEGPDALVSSEPIRSRRRVLALGGVAAAGAAAATLGLRPTRAESAAGDNFVLGQSNDAQGAITSLTSTAGDTLLVSNPGSGNGLFVESINSQGIFAKTRASDQSAVYALQGGGSGLGITAAVTGDAGGAGVPGVGGFSASGPGVQGNSSSGAGVVGTTGTTTQSAVYGQQVNSSGLTMVAAVTGDTGSAGVPGVGGISASGPGVQGNSSSGAGVVGTTRTTAQSGVYGQQVNSSGLTMVAGVTGDTNSSGIAGVGGISDSGPGVQGNSSSGAGVVGTTRTTAQSGVYGQQVNSSGLTMVAAVTGDTGSAGVPGVGGISASGPGVHGVTGGTSGTFMVAGVYGETNVATSAGVAGVNSGAGMGVYANSGSGDALHVVGKTAFSRSGVATVAGTSAAPKNSVVVSGVPLTPASFIIATSQTHAGPVAAAVPNSGGTGFTIYLSKSVSVQVNVAWFVIN